ncbi:MAG: hypothetical protein GY714_14220 [Desulfobacterales bacterium]|nr:hypothetical protein [Desulfobacterales bacterium]
MNIYETKPFIEPGIQKTTKPFHDLIDSADEEEKSIWRAAIDKIKDGRSFITRDILHKTQKLIEEKKDEVKIYVTSPHPKKEKLFHQNRSKHGVIIFAPKEWFLLRATDNKNSQLINIILFEIKRIHDGHGEIHGTINYSTMLQKVTNQCIHAH